MKKQSKLNLIAAKAKQDKRLKFISLVHHINEENLAVCYRELKRNKACGVDNVTVQAYGAKLNENLASLVERLKSKRYRPQPVRRVYIPKPGKSEKRALGIPTVEDKLVQLMLKQILESIYEADFLDSSYGFRPNRNCHMAVKALNQAVMTKPTNYIVEVDIRKFFDTVQHDWLMRCLEERVKDPNLLWLVKRCLKAGMLESGQYQDTEEGTPQGGVVSPLLANIYLHYVLDLWFEKKIKPASKGYMQLIRYADDYVVCCESEQDAHEFLEAMKQRLAKFGLAVADEKTRIVKFGRRAWQLAQKRNEKVGSFNFLGFTHYCAASRQGYFVMGHKTSKDNLRRKLSDLKEWIRAVRNVLSLKEWWPILKAKLTGHYNYFGVSGNMRCLNQYYWQAKRTLYKWINRRSQRKSMTWNVFSNYLQVHPLPQPRICYSLYTLAPAR